MKIKLPKPLKIKLRTITIKKPKSATHQLSTQELILNTYSMQKQFVVRKFIMAEDAQEAIIKDKKTKVHDVWLDDDWKKSQPNCVVQGFKIKK